MYKVKRFKFIMLIWFLFMFDKNLNFFDCYIIYFNNVVDFFKKFLILIYI